MRKEEEYGYFQAVNRRPADSLKKKLRKLGWKEGQCIYFDPANYRMHFFDSRKQLHDFLDRHPLRKRPREPGPRTLDYLADIELKMDQFEAEISQ